MYIPEDKIEEIRAAADIVDVVSDYVQLKRRGSNFVGLCPFHNEKTPSFNVNPGMGIFKCFGCGVGGNVYQFVTQIEGVGFVESVRMLAGRTGIPLPQPEDARSDHANEVEAIYGALRFAARYFFEQLTQTEAGQQVGLAYFKGRGFTGETIKSFGLGYAPDVWDSLLKSAEAKHIPPETLEKAGLIIPRKDGSGHYDRYRGRVIFPIFSHVGKVLGFGGRILTNAKDQPKYINSPETKVYSKGDVLYGLYQGKQEIRRKEEVILVEGYTDVISLHQAGVAHVVASSGTALTEAQVKAVGRYAKRVLLLYDADAAGSNAALRGIDLILARGLMAYAVALPTGEDPDSFVREQGGPAFEEYVDKNRQDFVTFIYAQARRAGALDTPEGTAAAQREVLASVARIPDTLVQESYLRRASEVLGIPDIQLRPVLAEMKKDSRRQERNRVRREERRGERREERREVRPAPAPPPPVAAPAAPPDAGGADARPFAPLDATSAAPPMDAAAAPLAPRPPAAAPPPAAPPAQTLPEEKTLLRLMLEHGHPLVEFVLGKMGLGEFTEGPARTMAEHFLEMYQTGPVSREPFLNGKFGEAVQRLAAEVLMDAVEPSVNWARKQNITVPRLNDDPYESAASAMTLLKLDRIDEAIAAHKRTIYQATRQGEEVRTLQAEMMHLFDLRKQIEQRAFLDWA